MKHSLGITVCVLALVLSSAASARAALLSWYRMGDDNVSPTAGSPIPEDPGGIVNHLSGGSAWGVLRGRPSDANGGGRPNYSDVVPSAQIFDPIGNMTYDNDWSFKTTTTDTSQGSKSNYKWDSQFTLEMFVYFDVPSMSSVRNMQFVNHQTSTSGGWRFYVENASGVVQDTIRAEFYTLSNLTTPIKVNGTTQMLPQTWYHLGLVYKENLDTSHTAELYVNHALEGTGAVPAGSVFGSNTFQVYLGHIGGGQSGSRSITIDEFRYFDEVIPSTSFLQKVVAPPPVAGDFDGDGDVDGADFVAWQTNFPKETGATLAMGDADSDGDVDGADFVVWQTNFPFTPGPGVTSVPEPWSLVTIICGIMIFTLLRASNRLVGNQARK
jgi:hypothetical protein